MKIKLLIASFLLAAPLSAARAEDVARQVQAHLLIGDPLSAFQTASLSLRDDPENLLLLEWAIRSSAACGKEYEMVAFWERLSTLSEKAAMEQDLLEEMAWGVLKNGQKAPSLNTQLISLIGAALTQDIRAVPFIQQGLHHSSAHLRALSVTLASLYGDYPLREEITHLLKKESVPEVRQRAISAVGSLHMEEYIPKLMESLSDQKSAPAEKLAAIEALIQMKDQIDPQELKALAMNDRAGLRQLCCEVIAHCELKSEGALLNTLINDPHPDVACAALKTWGLIRFPITDTIKQLAQKALSDKVGVTAAWVWLLEKDPAAEEAMKKWLFHDSAPTRALAASAVAAAGPYGIAIAKRTLEETEDTYVRVNLCVGLACQRVECEAIAKCLDDCLAKNKERWMVSEHGLFSTIERSCLSHNPAIPNYPELVNQKVRLEILNLLAILEYPGALEAIKSFLKERKWGITGLAAEMLLGEGDETAVELVRALLDDEDQEVRIESALVLASWGRDDAATPVLLEVYNKADRQLQLKILESLGRIGDMSTIPFLIERFKEQSLLLRVAAASVLIQTLHS